MSSDQQGALLLKRQLAGMRSMLVFAKKNPAVLFDVSANAMLIHGVVSFL